MCRRRNPSEHSVEYLLHMRGNGKWTEVTLTIWNLELDLPPVPSSVFRYHLISTCFDEWLVLSILGQANQSLILSGSDHPALDYLVQTFDILIYGYIYWTMIYKI